MMVFVLLRFDDDNNNNCSLVSLNHFFVNSSSSLPVKTATLLIHLRHKSHSRVVIETFLDADDEVTDCCCVCCFSSINLLGDINDKARTSPRFAHVNFS